MKPSDLGLYFCTRQKNRGVFEFEVEIGEFCTNSWWVLKTRNLLIFRRDNKDPRDNKAKWVAQISAK